MYDSANGEKLHGGGTKESELKFRTADLKDLPVLDLDAEPKNDLEASIR
jgi:hypothetical protein